MFQIFGNLDIMFGDFSDFLKNVENPQLVEDNSGSMLLPAKYDVANIHF